MKKSIYTKLLFACSILFLMVSCSKEEISTEQLQPELSHAEVYLSTHDVPAIMFSYNVLNTDTKVMNSFLIDDEGQIRTNKTQAFGVREITFSSQSRLQLMKEESTLVEGQSVTLDELVQNFNLMRTVDRIEYDSSVEKEGPQILTAAYAYYYDTSVVQRGSTSSSSSSSSSQGECGDGSSSSGGSTTSGYGSTGNFRAILLEQKLATDIVQKNETAKYTINWFNDLVNSSSIDLANN